MKIRIYTITALLILLSASLALSEDQAAPAMPAATELPMSAENNDTANTQWVWGEVEGVDVAARSITLKYLDYETDQEKEIALSVDDATVFDNAKALDEIQAKDNLSVDYIVKDGKNIAKTIGVEKGEGSPVADKADTATTTPAPAVMQDAPAAAAPAEAAPLAEASADSPSAAALQANQ